MPFCAAKLIFSCISCSFKLPLHASDCRQTTNSAVLCAELVGLLKADRDDSDVLALMQDGKTVVGWLIVNIYVVFVVNSSPFGIDNKVHLCISNL